MCLLRSGDTHAFANRVVVMPVKDIFVMLIPLSVWKGFPGLETQRMEHFGVLCRVPAHLPTSRRCSWGGSESNPPRWHIKVLTVYAG